MSPELTGRTSASEPSLTPPAEPGRAAVPCPDRLADLVAGGAVPFPADLPPAQQADLAGRVRQRRRDRLVRLIARAIADDLLRGGPQRGEDG
jgi:hypothetical protein